MKKLSSIYPLTLTNTLSGQRETFITRVPDSVSFYVCGITPYDYAHIGHGRCYVTFDVLYRLLLLLGYKVTYCRNFTDIDDKLLTRAEHEQGDPYQYSTIAQKYINAYHEDMQALNCLNPTYEPCVTKHIDQIVKFICGLIENKSAYVTTDGVYFSITSFVEYGKLSKRNLADLQAGARVQIREDKRNPLDFALWKLVFDGGPGWQSPWGYGRPGWHIECSAMAQAYLGTTLDIHAGGMDLIFPHHENEIAQSEGLHKQLFARYWLHNAFVQINKEKMSKSLGNFITLRQVRERFDPFIIRYYYLIHHYRNPLEFAFDDIESAGKSYVRLCKLFTAVPVLTLQELQQAYFSPLVHSLVQALCDDLAIARFFGILFENLKYLQESILMTQSGHDSVVQDTLYEVSVIKSLIVHVLGLSLECPQELHVELTPHIQELIVQREQARREKNWALADQLRDQLKALGYEVHDAKL